MSFQIGETVVLNSKEYKIVGTRNRSFLLEREGKQYKATADKMAKIQAHNAQPKLPVESELERRVSFARNFDASAKAPETEAEIMEYFEILRCDLSPENLTCDGELSSARVRARLSGIRRCWKELESKLGRKVAE